MADSAEGAEGSDRCVPEEDPASCDPGVLGVLGDPGVPDVLDVLGVPGDPGVAACP